MKRALVCGAGGFIGGHLVARLKSEGYWVRGVDIKEHEYRETGADEFLVLDLRSEKNVHAAFDGGFDEVYQLAADMGGAGYIFTGEHDADVMHNSAMINLNVAKIASECEDMPVVFYSSSACMYPEHNQMDPDNPNCAEDSAYPADPDSEYGWENCLAKDFIFRITETMVFLFASLAFTISSVPMDHGTMAKKKAPAAICRKVAEASEGGEVEVWGDGLQTRSFLYVDECLEGVRRLVQSDCIDPVNIGSDEMVSINQLVDIA